jgi:hypothetical protein
LIWFGVTGTLGTVPLLYSLQSTRSAVVAFLLISTAWLIVGGYTSINAVVKAELFPTKVRATGVGLPYAVTVSIFGGTAESIALWFKSIGHETWFYYYLTTVIAISLVVYVTMRDTRHDSAMGRHELGGWGWTAGWGGRAGRAGRSVETPCGRQHDENERRTLDGCAHSDISFPVRILRTSQGNHLGWVHSCLSRAAAGIRTDIRNQRHDNIGWFGGQRAEYHRCASASRRSC